MLIDAAAALGEGLALNLVGGRGKGDGGPLDSAELKDRGVARYSVVSLSRGDNDNMRGLNAVLLRGSGLPSCENGDDGAYERGVTLDSSPHALAP